jgi:hypothetical protein
VAPFAGAAIFTLAWPACAAATAGSNRATPSARRGIKVLTVCLLLDVDIVLVIRPGDEADTRYVS